MCKIFVCTNLNFGQWSALEYQDRDLANVVALDFIRDGNPVITVTGEKFRVWNASMSGQPAQLDISAYPVVEEVAKEYDYSKLYDLDWLGLLELYTWTTDPKTGIKKVCQSFYTYGSRLKKSEKLFSVTRYE